jgi:cytochrome P450
VTDATSGAASEDQPGGSPEVHALADQSSAYSQMAMETFSQLAAPQPNYRKLIEQGGFFQPMPELGLSYDGRLSEFVLRNHQLFSSRVEMRLGNTRPLIPLNVDPPQHSKYRKLLDPLFAPKRMDEQEADITRRVNHIIDQFVDQGSCNFTEEFAELFPSSVFLGLMGLPEAELRMFLRLRDGVLHPEKTDPDATVDFDKRLAVMNATGQEIYAYFGSLIDERAKHPTDDIVSRFLAAEIDGETLGREDILDILYLFLIAGLDTVSDSLTCFYAFLATHPDHRRRIAEDPRVIPSAVEELLRWESPVPNSVPRVATEDVTLPDGTEVPKGTAVIISYGAANVDPKTYPDGFDVQFDREANRHIAFGAGVHRCLGSHLARRELRVTLREWHKRIPDYWLTPGHEELEYPPGLRHVKDLMLTWT